MRPRPCLPSWRSWRPLPWVAIPPSPTPRPIRRQSTRWNPRRILEWQASTQAVTDDLLAEAQRLAELGDDPAALDRIDEALCAVLDPPDTIADEPAYLEFVAGLLAAAEELENHLSLGDDGIDDGREMVALPPIEIPDLPPTPSKSSARTDCPQATTHWSSIRPSRNSSTP